MECYRVKVPEGALLAGYTVAGRRVAIMPGEYHVQRLVPKARLRHAAAALRFVGADGGGGDLHVPLPEGADIVAALRVEVTPADEHAGHAGPGLG